MDNQTQLFRLSVYPVTVKIENQTVPLKVSIQYANGRLSITGHEQHPRGGGGQCIDTLAAGQPAPGWDAAKIQKLGDIWERWHLNDVRAGTPAQEDYIRQHKAEAPALDFYPWALTALGAAGLNPDPATGYVYGTAWLREEVPADVLAWLQGLP